MTPAKVDTPKEPALHTPAKPVRWLWEVRRYMARHGGGRFTITDGTGCYVQHISTAKLRWTREEIIAHFNRARADGRNQ